MNRETFQAQLNALLPRAEFNFGCSESEGGTNNTLGLKIRHIVLVIDRFTTFRGDSYDSVFAQVKVAVMRGRTMQPHVDRNDRIADAQAADVQELKVEVY